MATIVLVHGAWGGAHGWRKVRPLLRQAGHDVFTPSLTGIGERSHLSSPQVTLFTHVQDVVNAVYYEDLTDITLVGYSYGGMVVTGCLDYIGDRVKHLVYLDAFVPGDGQSLVAMTGVVPGSGQSPTPAGAVQEGLPRPLPQQDWLRQPMARTYDDTADGAWAEPRRSAQPEGTFNEPVRLLRPLEDWPFSLSYIKATADARGQGGGGAFWVAGDKAKASPRWNYYEVDTNHMVPFNKPRELADILVEVTK
jgi:pimeloyl-ACP methyl ester carboxylesterase